MNLMPFHFLLWHYFLLIIIIITIGTVKSSGVVIKTGSAKNHGQTQSDNAEDVKFHTGIANYEGEEGFHKDAENKAVISEDAGKFKEHSSKDKAHENSDNFQKENFHQTGGDQSGNLDSKIAHKKGHHKTGFTNSYHKDETGSNTSFYDDGNDESGQVHQKTYKDAYGDTGAVQQGGGNYDKSHFANDEGRRGLYDNSGRYQKDYGNNKNYNRNNYYDNKEDLARRNLANSFDGGQTYAEEQYEHGRRPYHNNYHHKNRFFSRPPPQPPQEYYPPPPLPYGPLPQIPQKHHITIYEDPRYVPSDLRYRRSDGYGDDYVELDLRSPGVERDQNIRYFEEPDYYYYN